MLFLNKFILLFICFSFLSTLNAQDRRVKHPGAREDGLTRIDSEGNYIYDVEHELRNHSAHLRVGMVNNPDVSVEITQYNSSNVYVVHFDDMYDGASKLSIGFDYEYFLTKEYGKMGLQAGFAAQYAEGHGRLASDPSQESVERFSFITMPIFLGAVYRFEYKDNQYIAPYVAGGGTYALLLEKRDDTSKVNAIGGFGFYAAAGGLLNITAFDRELASSMRTEYDVSNIWINLEFRTVQVTSEAFEYNNSFIQGGVSFDF